MRNLVDPTDDPAVEDAHRRGRILRALATCMAEKGYQSTTIADIARAGRVSKTVVYAHFRDKEQVMLELYSRATDHVLETVQQAREEAQTDGLPSGERVEGGGAAPGGSVCAASSPPTSGPSRPVRRWHGRRWSRCRRPGGRRW